MSALDPNLRSALAAYQVADMQHAYISISDVRERDIHSAEFLNPVQSHLITQNITRRFSSFKIINTLN